MVPFVLFTRIGDVDVKTGLIRRLVILRLDCDIDPPSTDVVEILVDVIVFRVRFRRTVDRIP